MGNQAPRVIHWHPLAMYPLGEPRVGDGNRLGVLVLGMVRLSMYLLVFLKVLRTFEALVADVTRVWLEGDMHAHVASDVVALRADGAAIAPVARKGEVIRRLAPYMVIAEVVVEHLGVGVCARAARPETLVDRRRGA